MTSTSLQNAVFDPDNQQDSTPFDRARYVRVIRFFMGTVAHFILWEIVLRRLLGQRIVSRSTDRRWQRIARRFRALAVELGGVLIKLGQFLSIRVDVLPQVVTAELAGLQDEVPAERTADIQDVLEQEYQRPAAQVFAWFCPEPEAAASLAQVHRAKLLDGDQVVVKVQRPRIETIVETDLRAIATAARWLKRYGPVRRRVDMDRIVEEFSRTTRNELDFVAEGQNAQRFAEMFGDDPQVRIPSIHAAISTRRVLVMEDVAHIKITDFDAIEAAGINRRQVAARLFDTYLRQLFIHNFLHADPHPGNLFIEPLAPGSDSPGAGRPFRLIFVDFGMVATVPERVRVHLRDYLLAFATQDVARMIRAYEGAGVLLPGADLARLEQMETELFERYAGLTISQVQQAAMNEWQDLAREYRDILYEMPFQFPADLLFVGRAMGILFAMAAALDPEFDPWQAIMPFAEKMAVDEARGGGGSILQELEKGARVLLSLPGQADRFFRKASAGELSVRTSWTPDATRTLRRIESAISRVVGAIIFAALLLAAVWVYVALGANAVSVTLFVLAALALALTLTKR